MTNKKQVQGKAFGLGIEGFLTRYAPESLTAEQWAAWREPVIDLIQKIEPGSRNAATVAASALCEAIAISGAEPGTPLVQVLSDALINRVASERQRQGRSASYADGAIKHLRRLQSAALGIPRKRTKHQPRTVGSASSLAALRLLAEHEDAFTRQTAQQLLDALEDLQPHRWLNPLPASTWRRFRTSVHVTSVIDSLRWDKLRSERVWEETHKPTPAITLIRSLNYSSESWTRLAVTSPLDVRVTPEVLRGGTVDWSHRWIVKDVPMKQEEPAATQPRRAKRKPSKAEARRIARELTESMANDPEPLSPALEKLLESWSPKGMPAQDWAGCRDLTHEVMRRSHIKGVDSFRKHIRMLAVYLDWAFKAGYPKDLHTVMTSEALHDYANTALSNGKNSTASTTRSRLGALARAVNPERNLRSATGHFQHNDVRPPYTAEDTYWILRRIPLVKTPTTRRAIQTSVALGLGAGLATGDLQDLTRADITDLGEEGIRINVNGSRPRTVWLRRDYEDLLREGISELAPGGRILGVRHHKDTIVDLYRNIHPSGNGPEVIQSRLRATWLATLMCEPIPLVTVLRVAGLATARTLSDLAPYIHDASDEKILRGAA